MTPKQVYNGKLGEKTVEALISRGFDAWYCENNEEALKKALSLIPDGASIAWGGTKSIEEIGLLDKLRAGSYELMDRSLAKDADEKKKLLRMAFSADWYLGSANALSMDGKLINIDGTGNRVAAMMFGPDNVLMIVGINKLALDEENALIRARNVAAPINAARFELDTPCAAAGKCMDCLKDNCICSYITVTRKCKPKGRIKVIIVGEELGY
jgi:hypothetical protein